MEEELGVGIGEVLVFCLGYPAVTNVVVDVVVKNDVCKSRERLERDRWGVGGPSASRSRSASHAVIVKGS